ncbi:MAG TPA: hypothetical protein DCW72_03380 [Elusimicrobia bacterium]|nr:hypothetical protein [Elusimicrobiota bacterium]HAU89294.1 hypothetical protein [Elusimicrobiota bacterium]
MGTTPPKKPPQGGFFIMKVLIVSLDNVGDTVISLAIHEALRGVDGLGAAWWTKDYSRAVVPLAGAHIEHYRCDPFWDRSPGAGKGGLLPFLRTILALRRARFDAALIVHGNWRKNLACLLAGIGRRYSAKGAFATDPVTVKGPHVLDSCRALLAAFLGRDPGELSYPLSPAAYGESRAARELFTGGWAVVHPFSGNPARNLPLLAWPAVLEPLAAAGLRVLVNVSPAEKELFNRTARGPYAARPADLVFSCDLGLSIADLAYAVSRAAVFVGNNSGPLHLASALGTPCVGVFQRSWVPRIAPRGKFHPLLALFTDSPAEIPQDEVPALVRRLLSARDGRPHNC